MKKSQVINLVLMSGLTTACTTQYYSGYYPYRQAPSDTLHATRPPYYYNPYPYQPGYYPPSVRLYVPYHYFWRGYTHPWHPEYFRHVGGIRHIARGGGFGRSAARVGS
jgi:hypothetical protein